MASKDKNKKNKQSENNALYGNTLIDFLQNLKKEQEVKFTKQFPQSGLGNTPPDFILEMVSPFNNIEKQLKKQKISFDPSVIKSYDKLIKSIVELTNEKFISKKKSGKLLYKVYQRSIKHVYFIYEMID